MIAVMQVSFFAGKPKTLALPKRTGSGWENYPANGNVCVPCLSTTPHDELKDNSAGLVGKIYGLQSDSQDALRCIFAERYTAAGYASLKDTFKFLSDTIARKYFPITLRRIAVDQRRKKQQDAKEAEIIGVMDDIGKKFGFEIEYSSPMRIDTFREELLTLPKGTHASDMIAFDFDAVNGTFTIGKIPEQTPIHIQYAAQLAKPGDYLHGAVASYLAERVFEGRIKCFITTDLFEGPLSGAYRNSSIFRHIHVPAIVAYTKANNISSVLRFVQRIHDFNKSISKDTIDGLTGKIEKILTNHPI
ncbi:hypothetical protein HY642_00580 [Candidatus Woesearchaeota archaeon]|nr:hypothetical protein [Candidatus Woesearchaeota archaeon]